MRKTVRSGMLVLIALITFTTIACTQNEMAKNFGGTLNVDLPAGDKLVTATWKDSELWYLSRPMRDGETAEVSKLQEVSQFGIVEGTVVFTESMKK